MKVNGKEYNLYGQFVERQSEWIGQPLEDYDMGIKMTTVVTGIELEPNGEDSAFFKILGEDFDCGFDVHYGGISGGEDGWITFSGYGGHEFRIKNKEENNNNND